MKRIGKMAKVFLLALCILALPRCAAQASAKIALNKTSVSVFKGKKVQLKVKGTSRKVTWKTSNQKVARVSQKGVVTGVKKGTATITARVSGENYKCKVSVKQPVAKVTLNKTSVKIPVSGGAAYLSATCTPASANNRKVTWGSSNPTVATVNGSGKITAVSEGVAVVTATAKDGSGKKATCTVAVTKSSSTIGKAKTVYILMIGNSLTVHSQNNTVSHLKGLAEKAGRKVVVQTLTHSGENLCNWANQSNSYGKKAYAKIASRQWDYIVLQECTDWAIAKGSTTVNAAKTFAAYINKTCPNAKIIYNSTWAWDKTKTFWSKSYKKSVQKKNMTSTYTAAAAATGGRVSWSVKAFSSYEALGGKQYLYLSDKNHCSNYGSFLSACSLYAAIFESSPAESGYTGGLDAAETAKMKAIAWQEKSMTHD